MHSQDEGEVYRLGAGDEEFRDFSSLQLKPDHYNRCACGAGGGAGKRAVACGWQLDRVCRSEECRVVVLHTTGLPAHMHRPHAALWPACRPLWVCPDARVFLETFSPVYKQVGSC